MVVEKLQRGRPPWREGEATPEGVGLQVISCQVGQGSSLVAHWISVSGDHGSNPDGGEKISFIF